MTEPLSPWTDMLGLPLPAIAGVDPEELGFIADDIAVVVIGGVGVSESDTVSLVEMLADEGLEEAAAETLVASMVAEATIAQAELAATHIGATAKDRLDAAFAEMNSKHIVARHDLGQTLSDGESDIDEIVDARIATGKTVRGSLFYHRQDLARAVAGQGLMLAFTGDRSGRDAAKAIGNEIRDILKRHGFKVTWNGSPDTRIQVDFSPLDFSPLDFSPALQA